MIHASRPVGTPAWLLWALLAWLIPSAASAHAIVLESSPAAGAVLARPPAQITLRFNSKIEKRFTRLTLATGNQPPAPVTLAGDDPATPDRLVIPIRSRAPGDYTLRYRVLAVDGHITEGALRFTVEP
ncbi:MAG TPA: copper resistance CopC family protein [Methylomirabilota bacterium]|nr:copper resistance CopC family protein [Methylomirabilota bacterium]